MEERIIERLRKVLALTNSPQEGEAQAAAAMLAKLLADHNLSIADLEQKGHKAKPGVRQEGHDLGKAAFTWKLNLAEAIAEHYFCHSLVDRKAKTVAFVGRPDNVESLKMVYSWVIDQIRRIASDDRRRYQEESGDHIDPLRWQVNFGIGAVERLSDRLRKMRTEEEKKRESSRPQGTTSMALVVQDRNSEISDYLEAEFGYRIDGKLTKRERESEERWEKYRREQQEREDYKKNLRITDIEKYYREFPEDHPDAVAARQKQLDKWYEKERKREERNEARRTGRYVRPRTDEERRAERQASDANAAGYRAGGKVNLTPFVGDGGQKGRKKLG